ncbi:hypothetical protein RFZ45_05195, partial [Acinetobacter baumannii]|nr:hypothetical protein [Acinetobacter baumannii]
MLAPFLLLLRQVVNHGTAEIVEAAPLEAAAALEGVVDGILDFPPGSVPITENQILLWPFAHQTLDDNFWVQIF